MTLAADGVTDPIELREWAEHPAELMAGKSSPPIGCTWVIADRPL
jgi:hypothetical protein